MQVREGDFHRVCLTVCAGLGLCTIKGIREVSELGTCVTLRCVVPDGGGGDRGGTCEVLLILLATLMDIN